MKTNFKFYFLMIIATALLSSLVYGLAESFVNENIHVFSFGLMMITVMSLAGMMRSLTMMPVARR